jgi:hypothetical protein
MRGRIVVALFKIKLARAVSFAILSATSGHWGVKVLCQLGSTRLGSFFHNALTWTLLVKSKVLFLGPVISLFKSSIHFVMPSEFKRFIISLIFEIQTLLGRIPELFGIQHSVRGRRGWLLGA